jgi:LPXTG-site transpeptidase (sortase) family protein
MYKFGAYRLFGLALFFFLFPPAYSFLAQTNFTQPSFLQPQVVQKQLSQKPTKKIEYPIRIRIPSVEIDLPVVIAPIKNGYWELSDTSASYGWGSATPGEKGNMVIFAHARQGLFLPLQNIQLNAKVIISTAEQTFTYKVVKKMQVFPSDTNVISFSNKEKLTLFTCTGLFDTKRLIVVAIPETKIN